MGFELFDKAKHYSGPWRKASEPEVGIQKAGQLSLNAAACEALGEPEAVFLLFDSERRCIGLQSCPPDEPRAFPIRRPSRHTCLVGGRSFLEHYRVDHSEARRYPARLIDDVLVVPLQENEAKLRGVG